MSDTPDTYESDTPETCEAVERWHQGKINIFEEMARLETERDLALVQFGAAEGLGLALVKTIDELKKERDEQTAQMCQAIGYLSTIAEDCEAWLNGESDEPSMEFVKAVRDYARKAVDNDDLEMKLNHLWENGRKAWSDVKDATAWVEELRGRNE